MGEDCKISIIFPGIGTELGVSGKGSLLKTSAYS